MKLPGESIPHVRGPRDAAFPPPIIYPAGPPLCLSAGPVTLAPGSTVVMDAVALNTHSGGAFLLEEVRLASRFQANSNVPSETAYVNPGGVLSCQLRMGGTYLTNGFVPWWLLGTQLQPQKAEYFSDFDWDANLATLALLCMVSFRWRFPRPLYVPHGAPILASIQRSGDEVTTYTRNHQVSVSYVGRVLPIDFVPPPQIDIPFATSWSTARGAVNGNSGSTLQNPFQSPLYVQRLVGRIQTSGAIFLDDFWGSNTSPSQQFTYVKMRDSLGQDIVGSFMEWSTIFDRWRKAWTFNRTLDPREWIQVLTRPDPFGAFTFADLTVMASLIGFRREAA